jgi:hypothetical protein
MGNIVSLPSPRPEGLCVEGVRYGPPGTKRLVYFVDDLNMPFVDKYDTQSAIELMRQSIDYKGWFDKVCQHSIAGNFPQQALQASA